MQWSPDPLHITRHHPPFCERPITAHLPPIQSSPLSSHSPIPAPTIAVDSVLSPVVTHDVAASEPSICTFQDFNHIYGTSQHQEPYLYLRNLHRGIDIGHVEIRPHVLAWVMFCRLGWANPYTLSLLDAWTLASKEPVYKLVCPSHVL